MSERKLYGLVAAFDSPDGLMRAARGLREKGFQKLDAHTPFPIHGIEEVLGIRKSPLGWFVFGAGIAGATAAVVLQWWTAAVDYPLVIGGKPLFAIEPSIPIIFELTILLAAFTAVGGMLALNGLPRFYHPLFEYEGFKKVSDDRFFLAVEAADPNFDTQQTADLLKSLGAESTALVEGEA